MKKGGDSHVGIPSFLFSTGRVAGRHSQDFFVRRFYFFIHHKIASNTPPPIARDLSEMVKACSD